MAPGVEAGFNLAMYDLVTINDWIEDPRDNKQLLLTDIEKRPGSPGVLINDPQPYQLPTRLTNPSETYLPIRALTTFNNSWTI